MKRLGPVDHAEEIATFRHALIGALCARGALDHGELAAAFRELAQQRVRPPGADATRTFSVATLERWYYAFKQGGLEALRPRARSDRGRGRDLPPELRELLCDIRREHPSASVPLILTTLAADGRLAKSKVKPTTVRRLLRERGLDRVALRDGSGPRTRQRWQAATQDALWHGDVCHGPTLTFAGKRTPLRIHALLDDYARFVVALEAHPSEREEDMLHVLVGALRRHGRPDTLYLDNGSTYRGEILRLACSRLGIALVHARPYDPEARGKMERFWRTLRERLLDHLGEVGSLHDVNVRLLAFLDGDYHAAPHAGLLGACPRAAYAAHERPARTVDDAALRDALTVRERRRVRRDTTFALEGHTFELDAGFLAGRIVTVAYCALDRPPAPWVELEGKIYRAHLVDPRANATRRRSPRNPDRPDSAAAARVPFDPPRALLDRVVGRAPRATHEEEIDDGLF
jgi:transposase InsO family protein